MKLPFAAVLAAAVLFTGLSAAPALAAISQVNSAAALGPVTTAITFDTPASSSLAAIALNYGVTITSADPTASPFITGPGYFSGIGPLSSNALGNTRNGLISDVSHAPDYSGSTLRAFDIRFAGGAAAFGLTVQGWGHPLVTHSFSLYDSADALLGTYLFSSTGLSAGDTSPNGFAGFVSSGRAIARVRVTPDPVNLDFVAFDNLTFVAAPSGAPEPAAWAAMIVGFGIAGATLRGSRSRSAAGRA